MRLKLVKIKETHDLSDEAKEACGEFQTIYLYDADAETYCCELTPSYWLEAVYFETENRIDDELYGDLQGCLYDSSHYHHVRATETFQTCDLNGDFDKFEDAREYASCNCWFHFEEATQ